MMVRVFSALFLVVVPAGIYIWWRIAPVETFGAVAAGLLFAVVGLQGMAMADLLEVLRRKRTR